MRVGIAARIWHGLTATVAAFALVVSTVLVVGDNDPPALSSRVIQLVGYFTIQSNVLVLITAATLVRRTDRDGPGWRVLRLNGLVGITVTGAVHWFLLRPLQDLSGWPDLSDKLLHIVVPLLAIMGWLAFGPRPRVSVRTVLLGLIWPVAWLIYIMIVGAISGWYPYPFLDVAEQGGGSVALAVLAVGVGLVAVSAIIWMSDRRLPTGRWDRIGTASHAQLTSAAGIRRD